MRVKIFQISPERIGVTNRKLPAQVYIDDRAYNYHGQTVKEFFMDFADCPTEKGGEG